MFERRRGVVASRWRRPVPWLIAGLVLAGLAAPAGGMATSALRVSNGVGYAHPSVAYLNVSVNLTDAPAFQPNAIVAPPGSQLTVRLHNVGGFAHSFTLANQSNVTLDRAWSPSQLDAYFAANGSLANVTLAAGAYANVTLNFSPARALNAFEFVSVVPYQFQAGMWGFLNVSTNVPAANLSDNATGNLAFVPNVLAASPTSYPATFHLTVTNVGSYSHTFSMAPQTNVTLSPGSWGQYFAAHAPLVNVTLNATNGATATATFAVSAPGVYEYICEVPGHFASGMYGYFYVGVPPPTAPPAPSTAIVESWVLVGSAALLGIGAVLLAASSLAGRLSRGPGGHR